MRDFDLISLDIESSGKEPDNHALLSIGCVRMSDFKTFYAELRHDSFEMQSEAARVHGLDMTNRDSKDLPTPNQVDEQLRDWLKSDPFYKEGKHYSLIPMGLNVGSFDMRFVRYWLPKSADVLGYRAYDLNSLLFDEAIKRGETFYDVKRAAKEIGHIFAIDHFGEKKPHNGLYDAWMGIGIYHYLHGTEPAKIGEVTWEGGKQ